MDWKYDYSNKKENNNSFNQIGLHTVEILMLKAVKQSFCYFTYDLTDLSIKI